MIFEVCVKIHYWLQGKYDQQDLFELKKHIHNTLIKIHTISIRILEYYIMHTQSYRIQIYSHTNYLVATDALITIPYTHQPIHLIEKQT